MQFETYKNFAVCATHLFTFCIGVENGVIIPSILEYLNSLGAQYEAILGVAIAGYGLAHCVSTKLLKLLVDASYSVRSLLTACSSAYVIGGIFYCFGSGWWGVVLARCCCGLGSGALAVITADISRNTLELELTQVYRQLMFTLALGWVLSPFLSAALLTMQPPGMNKYATPGLLTISMFILCGLLSAARFCDLGRTLRFCRLRQSLSLAYERYSISSRKSYGAIVDSSSSSSGGSENCARIYGLSWSAENNISTCNQAPSKQRPRLDIKRVTLAGQRVEAGQHDLTKSDEMLETAENFMGESCTPHKSEYSDKISTLLPSNVSTPGEQIYEPVFFSKFGGIFRKTGAACAFDNFEEKTYWLGTEFLAAFFFGCTQTMLTPLTVQFFLFGLTENAVAQFVLGCVGVAPIFLVPSSTKSLPLVGCLIAALSLCWLLAPAAQVGNVGSLPAFSVGMIGLSMACGVLFASCSLLEPETKFESPWPWGVGLVLGPLWAASTAPQPCLLLGAQLCLVLLATTRHIC